MKARSLLGLLYTLASSPLTFFASVSLAEKLRQFLVLRDLEVNISLSMLCIMKLYINLH